MDDGGSHWPIVLIEGVIVFGGALAFGWWQLRSIERDRREAARKKADAQAAQAAKTQADDAPTDTPR